ncbi:MAG: hypothetical protein ABI164_05300 [Acidobacteriaceae bacterium]
MKDRSHRLKALIAAFCVAAMPMTGAHVFAQTDAGATSTAIHSGHGRRDGETETTRDIEAQMREMRRQFQQQQEEIDQLKQQLQSRDEQLQQARNAALHAQHTSAQAQAQTQSSSANNEAAYSNLRQAVRGIREESEQSEQTLTEVQRSQKTIHDDMLSLAHGRVHLGALFYGDYAYYTHTGFGPQFLTQLNQDGPGNAGFNSFDITRAYLNFVWTPNDLVSLRITPNIYRQADGTSVGISNGNGSGIGSSTNGNLSYRIKYAYVTFNKLFSRSDVLKGSEVIVGQTMNPLVDWEEGLYGYRYVNLTPWNYLSLSSAYDGAELRGPIDRNGKEWLDYHVGVYNTASFHSIETNDKKQVMGRLTWYPFGTTLDRTGFGLTAFEDYGYNTKTPDAKSTPLNRLALLAHYQSHSKAYELAGEYDLGRNALSTGNLFSGASPGDLVGLGPTKYAAYAELAKALLAGDRTRQQGFALFGHADLGHSPFTLFGMMQQFQANTNIRGTNPLDFRRIVGGVSYKYNKYFQFAIDDQNFRYYHSQFTMPAVQIATFSPSLAAANPNGIPNVIGDSTNVVFANMQFSY